MSLRPSSGTKKLKKFFLEKTTPTKRIKALTGFIVSASKEEIQSFFIENNEAIGTLITEKFAECETAPKPVRKSKHYTTEFISLLHLTKKYVEICLLDRPQFVNELYEMLRKMLGYGNKHFLRLNGYEILITAIELLHQGKQPFAQFLPMLADGINFIPFYPEDQTYPPPQTFHPKALAPATTMPTIEEAVEMWDYFCDCIASKEENFEFWFGLFKREYLPTLFPSVARKLEIVSQNEIKDSAFSECPPQLQKILATHISIWMDSNSIPLIIWKPPHGQLILDICKQNCQLSVEYADTINLTIEKIKKFLLERILNSNSILTDIGGAQQHQIYLREFIQNISLVFSIKSTPETLDSHYQIGQKVLSIYKHFTMEKSQLLDQSSWVCLQETILKLVVDVLGGSNPFSINHISTISANEIFQHLFLVWIRSPHTTKEMWLQLSEKLCKMVQWNELLNQWKDKIIQLTQVMVELFFESKIKMKEAEEQRKQSRQLRTMTDITSRNTVINLDISFANKLSDQLKIKDLWYTLLNILGNLNAILSPENFTIAINCCAEVIDIILGTEETFNVDCATIIEIYHIFLPWLLEACSVEEKRNRGRLVAYSTLCKIFCRPQAATLPTEILCHFYRTLKQGLNSNHSSIIWTIIRYASSIFTLCLPGVNILIPDFLREISKLFIAKSKTIIPPDVQMKALMLAASLICFPDHFTGVSYSYKEDEEEKELTMDILKDKISTIFLMALQYDKLSPNNLAYLQYALSVLIMNDLFNTPRKTTIRECVKGILFTCTNSDKKVALSAIESLSTLKECYSQLIAIDISLISVLVYTMAENINNLIRQCKHDIEKIPDKEDVVVNHFYCLLDWLLVSDLKIIDYACLLEVFEAVELGLLGEALSSGNEASSTKEPQKKKNFIDRIGKTLTPSATKVKQKAAALLDSAANDHAAHFSEKIHEAAEIFLLNLLVKYNNFPAPEGATDGPAGCDDDNDSTLYFIYNQKSIFSFKEMTNQENGSKFVRVVIRDGTGKYTWDTELLNQSGNSIENIVNEINSNNIIDVSNNNNNNNNNVDFESNKENIVKRASNYQRLPQELPFFREGQNNDVVDMSNELLKYLEEVHPQLIPSGQEFQDKNILKIKKFNESVEKQDEDEQYQIKTDKEIRTPLPLYPQVQTPISAFQYCRLLISHLGYVSDSSRRMSFLTPSTRLKRSLKELDKINSRDMVKIGVLYVKEGQDHQNSILANEIASGRYTQFVAGLGWSVNLNTHKSYKGGLDPRTAGPSAVYYADPLYEIIFHDVTRMPSIKDDLQQIQKKRHVGNDNVQVIWSEHERDYDPSTITSQFNDAHIIIYPLDNGLHRIQIFQKEKLQLFGPLQSGMLISKKLLPFLVRVTSINANTACRLTSDLYRKPFSVRLDLLQEINRRYKCEKQFSEYISELIPSPLYKNTSNIVEFDDKKEESSTTTTTEQTPPFNTTNSSPAVLTRPKSASRATKLLQK